MTQFRTGCPIASTLDMVGDKWSLLIIRSMVIGASSFSDFLAMPEKIATNILADRLRKLESQGLITQARHGRGSIRGTYALTAKGAELISVLQAIARWGEANIPDRWAPPVKFYAAEPADYAIQDEITDEG